MPSARWQGEGERWFLLLTLSTLLHGLLLYWGATWEIKPALFRRTQSLKVEFSRSVHALPSMPAADSVAAGPTRRAVAESLATPKSPSPGEAPTTATGDSLRALALETARSIGRGVSRDEGAVPAGNLRASAAGAGGQGIREVRYVDGRIKVVDASGRAYCIKEPPDFVYPVGGVLPRLGVPTNCP